jgi:peptide-methionine (R)-S-oxide reductase
MDEELFKKILTPEQYRIMREKNTEEKNSGKYNEFFGDGVYACAACGNIVFLSKDKFDAKSGWPTFSKPANKSNLLYTLESGRMAIACKKCTSHLGYYLGDKEAYYEINSLALDFQEVPEITPPSEQALSVGNDLAPATEKAALSTSMPINARRVNVVNTSIQIEKPAARKSNRRKQVATIVSSIIGGIVIGSSATAFMLSPSLQLSSKLVIYKTRASLASMMLAAATMTMPSGMPPREEAVPVAAPVTPPAPPPPQAEISTTTLPIKNASSSDLIATSTRALASTTPIVID